MVVCEVEPHKEDPNRTRITVVGSQICYPGDVCTPTRSLELVKHIINSVLSRRNARFVSFDLKRLYLQTPMDRSEDVCIKFSDIPKEFIEEYDLSEAAQNGWIYFEILSGCCGLPQSVRLANNLLRTCLEKADYYEAATTPGLWCHKWRPIQFFLIVDNFGIEYVGKEHALHLLKTLEMDCELTMDWKGTNFSGIDLAWNYHARHANRTCRISMKRYIEKVLLKYGHPFPKKPKLSPHKQREISY